MTKKKIWIYEIIIAVAKEEYKLRRSSLKIYFTSNDELTMVRRNRVVINPQSIYSTGSLLYYVSDERLPAWLCAGLELYWLELHNEAPAYPTDTDFDVKAWAEAAKEDNLPDFGDGWFIPNFISGDEVEKLRQQIPQIAYEFVKFLDEKYKLAEIVQTYVYILENRIKKADTMYMELLREFTGQKEELGQYALHYRYNYFNKLNRDIMVKVYADEANYTFERDELDFETAMLFIDETEYSIRYVKNWFDYSYNSPLDITFTTKDSNSGNFGSALKNKIYLQYRAGGYPYASAHEVVHSLCGLMGDWSRMFTSNLMAPNDFYSSFIIRSGSLQYFEEGIATAIGEYLYALDNERYNEQFTYEWRQSVELYPYESEEIVKVYEERTGLSFFEEPLDSLALIDVHAYVILDRCRELKLSGELDGMFSENEHFYMYSYNTSASFVLYFLDQGTIEDFQKIRNDMSLMEELYGKDLDAMLKEWREYLGIDW